MLKLHHYFHHVDELSANRKTIPVFAAERQKAVTLFCVLNVCEDEEHVWHYWWTLNDSFQNVSLCLFFGCLWRKNCQFLYKIIIQSYIKTKCSVYYQGYFPLHSLQSIFTDNIYVCYIKPRRKTAISDQLKFKTSSNIVKIQACQPESFTKYHKTPPNKMLLALAHKLTRLVEKRQDKRQEEGHTNTQITNLCCLNF